MALTKRQVEGVKKLTEKLYNKALNHINPFLNHEYELLALTRRLQTTQNHGDQVNIKEELKKLDRDKEHVAREYERLICQLSTEKLERILQAHNEGKYRRAPYTLDAITTELLERSLRDSVRNKGKSNGKGKTVKRPSVKAKDKSSGKPGRSKATRR
jgi:hypothetical protein